MWLIIRGKPKGKKDKVDEYLKVGRKIIKYVCIKIRELNALGYILLQSKLSGTLMGCSLSYIA
jgi:hypothetical protein